MKKILLSTFLIFSLSLSSQKKELEEVWILDKYTLKDGSLLYANDKNFSIFSRYEFKNNKMIIDDLSLPITVTDQFISSASNKIQYEFYDKYLLLKTDGDDKVGYFLKPKDFVKIYPEFESKKELYNNTEVFVENLIVRPEFLFPGGFDAYLRNIFSNFEKFPKEVNEFVVQFIVTKDSKIKDIKIIKSVSDKFDKMAVKEIENSEKYFSNSYDHDFLITKKSRFIIHKDVDESNTKESKRLREIEQLEWKANGFYTNNDFQKAINEYEKLKTFGQANKSNNASQSSIIKLGVSYLASGKVEEACKNFKEAGSLTDFSVRNYLINFCKN